MMQIRPVSDLRNKFPEIEKLVNEEGTVYLTKNGYGTMVVMSIEQYSRLADGSGNYIRRMFGESDEIQRSEPVREMFTDVKRRQRGEKGGR